MRTKSFLLFAFVLFAIFTTEPSFAGDYSEAFPSSIDNFRSDVANEVNDLLTDGDNIISKLRTIVIRVLYFLLLFYAIADFIANGFSANRTLNAALMGFLIGILNEMYLVWTEGIYLFFEVGALGIQESVTGTTSKFFLSTYMRNLWNEIDFISVDIFDGLYLLFIYALFIILKFFLLIIVYLTEMWAIWGFSFAQLIGPIFIPFIIFPSTRPLFDKWLALLVSFAVYAFVVRVVGVLFAIFTKSILGSATYTETLDNGITLSGTSPILLPVLVHCVIGICMLLGAGKISVALAGGIGNSGFTASSIGKGGAMAKKMFTRLMV